MRSRQLLALTLGSQRICRTVLGRFQRVDALLFGCGGLRGDFGDFHLAKFFRFFCMYLFGWLNNCMNFRDAQQRKQTDQWFSQNGIKVAHIYAGTAELFQATKLATATLKHCGRLLEQNQAQTLNHFLKATRSAPTRQKITQGQCFKVMNIAKQAQRKSAQLRKAAQ